MLKGYELGADDYVTKPFPMSVFQKKVSALLARIRKQSGGDCYNDGDLFINFTEMTALLHGESIAFTPMEYRLLKVLTKNPQIVLTGRCYWKSCGILTGNFVDEHALTSTISRVRTKIETEGRQYIKTVYGMGSTCGLEAGTNETVKLSVNKACVAICAVLVLLSLFLLSVVYYLTQNTFALVCCTRSARLYVWPYF